MKTSIVLILLTLAACGGGGGNSSITPDGNLSSLSGSYSLTRITTACVGLLDEEVDVEIDGTSMTIFATTSGYGDAVGEVEGEDGGAFDVNGSNDGIDYNCTGTIENGIASGACTSDDLSITCSFTYEK